MADVVELCKEHNIEMRDAECWICGGDGEKEDIDIDGFDFVLQPCWHCDGKGTVPFPICELCEEEALESEIEEQMKYG